MTGDDWILKIPRDREAAGERAELDARLQLERRRNFEGKVDDLWKEVATELARAIDVYNAECDPGARVVVEQGVGPTTFSVLFGNAAALRIFLDRSAEVVRSEHRMMQPDRSVSVSPIHSRITTSKAGDLSVENQPTVDFTRSALEPFLRGINGLP